MLYRLRLLLFVFNISVAHAAYGNQQDYPFKLSNQADAGRQKLMAQNNGPAPILLYLNLASEDAIVEPSNIVVTIIKPYEKMLVATIRSKVPGQRYHVASHFKFSIGNPDAIPDPQVSYRLPFSNGQTIIVGQVVGGRITTHSGLDSKYAIDFDVPIGTPVLAARKGVVVDIEQDFAEGGNNPKFKANHVLLLHEDGTLGLYAHLAVQSHVVTFGQTVKTGDLIGYSGNTGYSTGPHLHFSVLSNAPTRDGTVSYKSHPIKFVDFTPPQEIKFVQDQKLKVKHEGAMP